MRARGFTLVELVMVIMITGILAASVTIFLVPAVNSYFDTRRRADLTDMADTALRRMSQDIRRAVPNSIRSVSVSGLPTCFQLVPTIAGGRYRKGPNTTPNPTPPQYLDAPGCTPSATCSAPLDTTQATTEFDVLSPMPDPLPVQNNDWVVIGNQNADDVYTGVTRGQISAAPKAPPDIRDTDGLLRIEIETSSGGKQFPSGYDGGRFVVVSNAEQAVFYSCVDRTLYRTVTAFGAAQATSCALTSGAGVAVVATDVENCTFVYDPNKGATQQSGFVWMKLQLTRSGESVTLSHGAHVDNVP